MIHLIIFSLEWSGLLIGIFRRFFLVKIFLFSIKIYKHNNNLIYWSIAVHASIYGAERDYKNRGYHLDSKYQAQNISLKVSYKRLLYSD
jgi:hypothetical protein